MNRIFFHKTIYLYLQSIMSLVRSNKSKHTCINNAQTLWMNVSETCCTRRQDNKQSFDPSQSQGLTVNPLTNERSTISIVSGNNRPSLQITIVGSWGLSLASHWRQNSSSVLRTEAHYTTHSPQFGHSCSADIMDRKWGAYIHSMMGLTDPRVDSGNGQCPLLNDRFNSMVQK